jgi:O-methyltransferase
MPTPLSRRIVDALLRRTLGGLGYEVRHASLHPRGNPERLWEDDAAFQAAMRPVRHHTLVDTPRCWMLWQLAHQARRLPSDAAELGVWRGGTARLLDTCFAPVGKVLHLFDTFEGMPPTDAARDLHRAGDFADTSRAMVEAFLGDTSQVRFHVGRFPATAELLQERRFCFVHVDADIYTSVRDACNFFHPRLERGGILVFDDYGFVSCPGARQAVDEYFAGTREKPVYLPTGQAIVIKSD